MDWWFKLSMMILLPTIVVLLIALVVPLPKRQKKWGPRDY